MNRSDDAAKTPDISRIADKPSPPPSGLLCHRSIECFPWQMVRRNGSPDWLALYTYAGVCGAYQEKLLRELRIGDLLIFAPGAFQHIAVRADENWSFFWAHFTPRPSWLELLRLNELGKKVFFAHYSDDDTRTQVENTLNRCRDYLSAKRTRFAQELGMTCLEEVLYLAAGESAASNRNKRTSPEIAKIIEHLNLHYKSSHSLNDLAKLVYLSPSRFAHRFKSETGDSVIAYLLKLRLRDAAQQLELTSRSAKTIAESVGFRSDTHFSRLFRKQYGVSPLKYRRR